MSDREELADAIMSTHRVERHPELRRANSLVEADGILASTWLTRHEAEVAAKALEDASVRMLVAGAREREMHAKPGYGDGVVDAAKSLGKQALALRASSLGAEKPETTEPAMVPSPTERMHAEGASVIADIINACSNSAPPPRSRRERRHPEPSGYGSPLPAPEPEEKQ